MKPGITKNMIAATLTTSILGCTSVPLDEKVAIYDRSEIENIVEPEQILVSMNEQERLENLDSIFFEFDKYSISEEYKTRLENYAQNLVNNQDLYIRIEGHTDERGSTEYNLALGQKRADSVRQILILSGVHENQIETISFGKGKPKSIGSTETNFSENRRADLIIYENK